MLAPEAAAQFPSPLVAGDPDDPIYDTGGSFPPPDAGQWNLRKINMPEAWDLTTGSADIIVAVIDTRFDLTHPDLAEALWVNEPEDKNNNGVFDPPDIDGVDDDGNGYEDDVNGRNFARYETYPTGYRYEIQSGPGQDAHGTRSAGVIFAESDNGRNIAGIAGGRGTNATPRVRFMPVRINAESNQKTKWIISIGLAVEYAHKSGADVISMSLQVFDTDGTVQIPGRPSGVTAYSLIQDALNDGVVIVAASGNEPGTGNTGESYPKASATGTSGNANGECSIALNWPANHPGVISVGASKFDDTLWDDTCGTPTLVAPGGEMTVPSLRHHLSPSSSPRSTSDVFLYGGTSAATPHVAGVAALLLSINPTMTRQEVEATLVMTADDTICSASRCGAGRLDAYAALTHALATYPLSNATVERGWDVGTATLKFEPAAKLTVDGDLYATGTTFTASAPASGWGGIRFQPGSGGTLTDAVIEKVYGWAQYAVWIDNASPSFDDVRIDSPVSSLVGGVYVTGSQASPMLHELTIDGMNYGGVTLASQAEARLTDGIVTQSGHGLVAGYLTEGFLYPSLGGARTVGNQFNGNTSEGVRATSYADLYFGYYYYPQSGIHNNGFNSVTNSGNEGVEVTGGGYIAAGNSSNHQRNRFFGNTGDDGYASGSGSSLSALCNWWNDTTPPFRTSTASGGYLNDSFWLSQDPYVNPNAACTDESFRQAGASRSQRLAEAAAMEQPAEALAALSALVTEAPASPEAASALATVGRLAARDNAPQGARGLLQAQAATRGPLRSVARRSVVALQHRDGRVTDALAGTEALLADPDSDDDVLFAHVARVHLLSEQGRTAEAQAAYEAIEALASGSVEARLARDHLGLPYERTVEPRTPESAEAVSSFAVGPVHPNPTASSASVTFALPEAATVRVSVLDVLGREVAVAADDAFDAGRHTASVDVSALAPGIYLARVAADGETAVVTRRFTVAR